jgi:membrane-bound lytic murein transglycosylase A
MPSATGLWGAAALAVLLAGAALAAPAGSRPVSFADIPGWAADDHGAAFAAFRTSCPVVKPAALAAACAAARRVDPSRAEARLFFERWFEPRRLIEPGFLTAYFEPELSGSLTPDAAHSAPALALPSGDRGDLPDRAAIEAGALRARSKVLLYLDPIDLFVTQVQGSARIRLTDGRALRLAYAGRNGKPYTAIGKVLVDRGIMKLEDVTMDRIVAWLRANPEAAPELMRQNRSYVFFRIDETLDSSSGPIGGAGISLTAGRSLAVDRSVWPYGLPVWIDAEAPGGHIRRLTVAQDTGTAIVGPGRADLFLGTGTQAGTLAGNFRHPMSVTVLMPREPGAHP